MRCPPRRLAASASALLFSPLGQRESSHLIIGRADDGRAGVVMLLRPVKSSLFAPAPVAVAVARTRGVSLPSSVGRGGGFQPFTRRRTLEPDMSGGRAGGRDESALRFCYAVVAKS